MSLVECSLYCWRSGTNLLNLATLAICHSVLHFMFIFSFPECMLICVHPFCSDIICNTCSLHYLYALSLVELPSAPVDISETQEKDQPVRPCDHSYSIGQLEMCLEDTDIPTREMPEIGSLYTTQC